MKKLLFVLAIAGLALLSPSPGYSQAALTSTTLSAAVTNKADTIFVASATGLAVNDLCYVDREAMRIQSIDGTTLKVRRATDGIGSAHLSGAPIVCDPPNYFSVVDKAGVCVATDETALPVINVRNGKSFDCTGPTSSTQVWTEIGGPDGNYVVITFCGDQPNNTTNYNSPIDHSSGNFYAGSLTANDLGFTLAGTGCDAEDNTTEATADEVVFANNAIHVLGLSCTSGNAGSNGTTINVRSAAASLTPDITVTIPTTLTTAAVTRRTTVRVAAGATLAIRQISTEDLSATNIWCQARVQVLP